MCVQRPSCGEQMQPQSVLLLLQILDMLEHGRPPHEPDDGRSTTGEEEDDVATPKHQRPWDIGAVCEALIDHCLRLGSRDNMSVVIVVLQPNLVPKPA